MDRSTFRLPNLSPSDPPVSRNAASVSVYPFITHCRAATPVPKSRPMVGKAMLTTVASSAEILEPSTVTVSTHRPGAEEYARAGASAAVMAAPLRGQRPGS